MQRLSTIVFCLQRKNFAFQLSKSPFWLLRLNSNNAAERIKPIPPNGTVTDAEKESKIYQLNTKLNFLLKYKKIREAVELFQKSNHIAEAVTFNIMLSLYKEINDEVGFFKTLRMMTNRQIPLALVTYSIVIDFLGSRGDAEGMINKFKEMLHNGIDPDEVTLNSLLRGAIKAKNWELVEKVRLLIKEYRIPPNNHTLNLLLSYCRQRENPIEASEQLWKEYKSLGVLPNEYSISTMMSLYLMYKPDPKILLNFVHMLLRIPRPLSLVSRNNILSTYSLIPDIPKMEALFNRLLKKSEANHFSYSCMLTGYQKAGKKEKFFEYYNEMKSKQMRRSGTIVSVVVDLFEKDMDGLLQFFESNPLQGFANLQGRHVNKLLSTLVKNGKENEAKQIYERIQGAWIDADSIIDPSKVEKSL